MVEQLVIEPNLFGLVFIVFQWVFIYILFEMVSEPMEITQWGLRFNRYIVPLIIIICVYGVLVFLFYEIYSRRNLNAPMWIYLLLAPISLIISMLSVKEHYSNIDARLQEREFRKQYPLRKVK